VIFFSKTPAVIVNIDGDPIGLQIGSASMFTITAGVLLKKITGGSALTPSTFFGRIWLLSTCASTR